jgi:hypothetical protein
VVQPSIQLLGSVECGKHSPLCHLAKLEAGDRRWPLSHVDLHCGLAAGTASSQ